MNQEAGGGRREAGLEPKAEPGRRAQAPRVDRGTRVLAVDRGAPRDRGLPRAPPPGVSRADRLRRQPPGAPVAHGRVDRAGRFDRLHAAADRADFPVRQGARGDRPGRGPPLRHGAPVGRLRARHPRQELRRTPRQDRGQRPPSREPRRHRRLRAGLHPQHVRPRPVAGDDRARADSSLERLLRRGAPGPREGAADAGSGPAHPDGHRDLADARIPDRRRAGGVSGGEVGRLGTGRARERLRRHAARLRRGPRTAPILRCGGRRRVARERFPGKRPVHAPARARLHVAPAAGRRRQRHEPPLRRRVDAEPDGRPRRSPASDAARRDRDLRPGGRRRRRGDPGPRAPPRPRPIRRCRRRRLEGAPRLEPRRRGRDAAPVRARSRPRNQRRPRQRRQDRPLCGARGGEPVGADRRSRRARGRHGGRPGLDTRDRRRKPRLQRAGRPRVRKGDGEGRPPHPPRPLRRRDLAPLPLARGRGPFTRELERRARGGRDDHDPAAADRAPLLGQDRARGARRILAGARAHLPRHHQGRLARQAPRRQRRSRMAEGASRRCRRRLRVRAADTGAEDLPARHGPGGRRARTRASRSSSGPTRRSATAPTPTTAGCRSSPSP